MASKSLSSSGEKKFFIGSQRKFSSIPGLKFRSFFQPRHIHNAHQPQEMKSNRKNQSIFRYLLYAIPATAFVLGTWQVYRRDWKLDLIERYKEKVSQPGVEWSIFKETLNQNTQSKSDESSLEFTKVKLKGCYLGDSNVKIQSRTKEGQLGVFVITPFLLEDGSVVLINRGWAPMSWESNSKQQESKKIELNGLLRKSEEWSKFTPKNNPTQNDWFWIDIPSIISHVKSKLSSKSQQQVEYLPVLFDLVNEGGIDDASQVEPSTEKKYPQPKDVIIPFRNNHLEYAITWYSLSAATTLMLLFSRRSSRRTLRTLR